MTSTLKPWREVAVPHDDVLRGTFQEAEFAADLVSVHEGRAYPEYGNPEMFFQRTFITEGMRLLLQSVLRRLTGHGGDPVIQLQTAFGGGKTHTLLAVYHLARGQVSPQTLQGIPPILDSAGVTDLAPARVAVIDGNQFSPGQVRPRGDQSISTMWGDLAWQLGQNEGYLMVKDADTSGTSPGKELLRSLLEKYAPCVVLIDELVAYIRQFDGSQKLSGGTYDSNLSFIQALTEAVKGVKNAVILASLPESEREAGSSRGVEALRALEHYFGRVQALWKPVSSEEAFEIVRRRLFKVIPDPATVESVCRAFSDFYTSHGNDFPDRTLDRQYYDRLCRAYPIHPELFDRLYDDWASLDNFQRTRGVLKLLAKVIHRLWKDHNLDPMILPGALPLYDPNTRNELLYYLPPGWTPVLERDIDGDRSEPTELESKETYFGAHQACRRVTRTIFLGSPPSSSNARSNGLQLAQVLLGTTLPGQPVSVYRDALARLVDRLHFLNSSNGRYWFDTRPNLRREMEDRKRRFDEREAVVPYLRRELEASVKPEAFLVHVFRSSNDIPDDLNLRLVVLGPDDYYTASGPSRAHQKAEEILNYRGNQPRTRRNRLIFLATEFEAVNRLRDQIRTILAWESITEDIKLMRLNLDQFQAHQAREQLDNATKTFKLSLRHSYQHLLVPYQDAEESLSVTKWEVYSIDTDTPKFSEALFHTLKDAGVLVADWAPIHLHDELRRWFWKPGQAEMNAYEFWEKSCSYLFLTRLSHVDVLKKAITSGLCDPPFFGIAKGKSNGDYLGFSFDRSVPLALDRDLILIEPGVAQYYQEEKSKADTPKVEAVTAFRESAPEFVVGQGTPRPIDAKTKPKRGFYLSQQLTNHNAKIEFNQLYEEIALLFLQTPGMKVQIDVDIRADAPEGIPDDVIRSLKQNCRDLKLAEPDFTE